MATRNTTDMKRFVSRAPDKTLQVSLVSRNEPTPRQLSNFSKSTRLTTRESSNLSSSRKVSSIPLDTSMNTDTSQPDTAPARRVFVIRNTKNPQTSREPVDISDFGQGNSARVAPVISNQNTSVYFIRRPVGQARSMKPIQ